MAPALFESLLMNHPFVDGNKRVAFFATDVFLRLNGRRMLVDGVQAHRFLIELLASHEVTYERLRSWIGASVRPLRDSDALGG